MPIQIPEPQRETFLAYKDRAKQHGPAMYDKRAMMKVAGDVKRCEELDWWMAVGVIIGLSVYEMQHGPSQEG